MADGSTKAIKDVKVGDTVMATDPEIGETKAEEVTAEIKGEGIKHLVDVTIDTDGTKGSKTADVTATDGHPFWVPELGEWIDATDLQAGQWLQTGAGTLVQITAIQRWTAQGATVHNLTVSNIHTYYVLLGATPVLVHNCGVVDAARAEADAVADLTGSQRPQVIEALQVEGHTPIVAHSDGGAGDRRVHPAVRAVLDSIPAGARGNNHGGCGLVQCLTEALDAQLDPTGATAAATMGRTRTNKNFQKLIGPCPSCQALVEHFNIDFKMGD